MRNRITFGLLVMAALLPSVSLAQLKMTLKFDSAGDRVVWFGSSAAPPAKVEAVSKDSIELQLGTFTKGDHVFVWDKTTGNMASKAIDSVQNAVWTVPAAEFNLVAQVTVHVEHKGLPVAAGQVTLANKSGQQSQILDPSTKGDAQFYGIAPGDVKVGVTYRSGGKTTDAARQTFELKLKRDKPDVVLPIAIADDVEVIGAGSDAKLPAGVPPLPGAGMKKPEEPQAANPVGTIVVMLLGLAAAGAVGYFAMMYMKNNPKKAGDLLQKVGVQIPEPGDPAASDPPPPAPIAPQPPQKIILDDAHPDPISTPIPSTPMTASEPQLVMENGDVFPIPEGETTVGREVGLGLSLVGEGSVSRSHASLTRSDKSVVVKDLGSTNGTFVNGAQVQGESTLRPGDAVQFGSVKFRYEG